jgi:hypothetical protein
MDGNRMFELAQGLAAAKSRQDVAAALKLLDKDMVLEAPALSRLVSGCSASGASLSPRQAIATRYTLFEFREALEIDEVTIGVVPDFKLLAFCPAASRAPSPACLDCSPFIPAVGRPF